MLHIPSINYHLLAAKQQPYQKAYLNKIYKGFIWGKSQENGPVGIKKKKKKKEEKKKRYDRKRNGIRQKNNIGDSKVESNDSPLIPDGW